MTSQLLKLSLLKSSTLNYNQLKEKEYIQNPLQVKELDASKNIIEIIDNDIQVFKELRILDISLNQIRCLQLPNLEHLQILQCSYNQIQKIEFSWKKLPNLKYLDLSYNQLKSLSDLKHLNKLQVIDISGNQFDSKSFVQTLFSLRQATNLKLIGLENLTCLHKYSQLSILLGPFGKKGQLISFQDSEIQHNLSEYVRAQVQYKHQITNVFDSMKKSQLDIIAFQIKKEHQKQLFQKNIKQQKENLLKPLNLQEINYSSPRKEQMISPQFGFLNLNKSNPSKYECYEQQKPPSTQKKNQHFDFDCFSNQKITTEKQIDFETKSCMDDKENQNPNSFNLDEVQVLGKNIKEMEKCLNELKKQYINKVLQKEVSLSQLI